MKKIIAVFLMLICLMSSAFMATGCGPRQTGEKIDENKTQLYVASYSGGVGTYWLDEVINDFEAEYSDWEGEDGKVGVQIIEDYDKDYLGGTTLTQGMPGSSYEVYFTQQVDYFDYVNSAGVLADITDLVTKKVNEKDGKTIFSKLTNLDKTALKIDNKIYAIPHYELIQGLTYDATVFKDKKLYFSNEVDTRDSKYVGTNKFATNASDTLSCGPDGEYDTYDDGLPSTFMELHKLVDKMSTSNVKAFVWTGEYSYYTNMLLTALWSNYVGIDGINAVLNFNSNGNPVEIVTGFNSNGTPRIESKVIDKNNAYLVKQMAGLYYAVEFGIKVFGDSKYYDINCTASTVTHINAHELFMNSGLSGGAKDAMLIEGNYWYNEASDYDVFTNLKNDYPETYTDKDVKFMPLPRQYAGTVAEGKGKPPVLVDTGDAYAFINSNIKSTKKELAEEFLSFCYSDEQLIEFTKNTNGVTRGLTYDYMQANSGLNSYAQSLLNLRAKAVEGGQFARAFSNNLLFVSKQREFCPGTTNEFWSSSQGSLVAVAAKQGKSAKDYFNGMAISESEWNSSYKSFLN